VKTTDRLCALVLAASVALSTALSSHWAASLALVAAWFWTLAIPLALHRLQPRDGETRLLLIGLALGGLVGAALVFVKSGSGPAPFPLYGHARLMGLHLLASSLAALVLLTLLPCSRRERLLIGALAFGLCAGLFWTGGRAPILGLVAACLACLWSDSPQLRPARAFYLVTILGLGLLASFFVPPLGAAGGLQSAWERTSATTSLSGVSSGRLDFWSIMLRHALEAPWIGHGADSYNFLRPRQDGNQPHNFLLQWFGDFGVTGLLAASALIGRAWWRGARRARGPAAVGLSSRCGWIGACGLLTAGLLDGVFYHAIVLLPTALFLGLLPASANHAVHPSKTTGPCVPPRFALMSLSVAALILAAHQYLFFSLLASPPDSAKAPAPRLLRIFPSTTNSLWRWLEHWKQADPKTSLEWARWAQHTSHAPALYHEFAGRLWIAHGNLDAAEAEYHAGLLVTHHTGQAHFKRILNLIAQARREASAGVPEAASR
jgi:O-antigen ligase